VISVAKIGEKKAINKMRVSFGKPLQLPMPAEPGEYELRYQLNGHRPILATRTITVNKMTLNAPDEASVGETVPVSWNGPSGKYDSIFVVEIGKQQPSIRVPTKEGSPFRLRMPVRPGEFEIRYVYYYGGKGQLIASRPITVKAAKIALDAPDEASVGESFAVSWQGPDADGDTIEIGKPGEAAGITSSETNRGNPLVVPLPTKPGEYEIRYVLKQGGNVLGSRPLTVNEAQVLLDAPKEANAGESGRAWG